MNEFDLIGLLTRNLATNKSVVIGPGDDCAVLEVGIPGHWLLFKTDALVAGIHFTEATPPEKIGRKALARCLSDIAAMAGTPVCALVTLALPRDFKTDYIESMYRGMNALAARFDVGIAGGETTTNPDRVLISVAALGTVAKGKCPLRSGAEAGDAIFVTGELGGSLHGKHLEFLPRLAEARWLVDHFTVHAMIDLSDGLAGDLRHILNASQVGAQLFSKALPVSRAAKLAARRGSSAKSPLLAALTDGEDFELLFTVPSRQAVQLSDEWKKQFADLRLTCIGKTTAQPGLTIRDENGVKPLTADGYVHFQKP
jgi:thiamine-monophosphate kinase